MNGKRVIRSQQQKLKGRTYVVVYLEVTPEIERLLDELGADMKGTMPLIQRRDEYPYTYAGLNAIM